MDGEPQVNRMPGRTQGAKRDAASMHWDRRGEGNWGSSFDLGVREGVGYFMSEGIVQTLVESVET